MKRVAFASIFRMAMVVFGGLGFLNAPAQADLREMPAHSNAAAVQSRNLEDVIADVPLIGKIPHSYMFGGEYRFDLTGKELRIDHMGPTSQSSIRQRACMICLTWATPVAFFGSEIELPLFHAEMLQSNGWRRSSLGDYVVHLSKDGTDIPWVGLKATLHF